MAAYVIYHYRITNPRRLGELTELSGPINQKYGAEVLVGSPVKALEGRALSHMVILRFRDFEAAENYYYSAEHEQLSKIRNDITEGWSTIVPGCSETRALVESGYFE